MKKMYMMLTVMFGLFISNTQVQASVKKEKDPAAQLARAIEKGDVDKVKNLFQNGLIKDVNYIVHREDRYKKSLCVPLKSTIQLIEQERKEKSEKGKRLDILAFLMQRGAMVDGIALRIIAEHDDLQKVWSTHIDHESLTRLIAEGKDRYTGQKIGDLKGQYLMIVKEKDGEYVFYDAQEYASRNAQQLKKAEKLDLPSVFLYEYKKEDTVKEFPFELIYQDGEKGVLDTLKRLVPVEQLPTHYAAETLDSVV